MSERTRTFLGEQSNLAGALGTAATQGRDFQLWRVMTLPDRLVMGAGLAGEPSEGDANALGELRDHFLLHYFRLEKVERRLSRKKGSASRAQRVIEEERKRLAQELHSDVNHLLVGAKLTLDEIERKLPAPVEMLRSAIERIRDLILQAIDRLRDLAHHVRLPDWLETTLTESLRRLWEMSGIEQNYEAALKLAPLAVDPGYHVKSAIYRAAQEGLMNIPRHARATHVRLSLDVEGEDLALRVWNDGASSPPESKDKRKRWGIGLSSVREQVRALGGKMSALLDGDNFTLEIRTPLYGGDF